MALLLNSSDLLLCVFTWKLKLTFLILHFSFIFTPFSRENVIPFVRTIEKKWALITVKKESRELLKSAPPDYPFNTLIKNYFEPANFSLLILLVNYITIP